MFKTKFLNNKLYIYFSNFKLKIKIIGRQKESSPHLFYAEVEAGTVSHFGVHLCAISMNPKIGFICVKYSFWGLGDSVYNNFD